MKKIFPVPIIIFLFILAIIFIAIVVVMFALIQQNSLLPKAAVQKTANIVVNNKVNSQQDQLMNGYTNSQYLNDAKTYVDQKYGFSLKYPAHWSWEMVTAVNIDTNHLVTFVLQTDYLRGPSRTATMSFNAQDDGPSKISLESDINFVLSSFPRTLSVIRNMPILPHDLPPDMQAEAIQFDGYVNIGDGTQRHVIYLYLFAIRGNYHYRFQLSTDAEDYDNIYPLAVAILSSLSFK